VTNDGRPAQALGRGRRPAKKAKTSDGADEREPLTRQKLEQQAAAYLNRFDVTASKLKQYLTQRARKLGGHADAAQWITETVERYLGSGMLDDARFAKNLASRLTSRGKSSRAISQKLAQRGVPGDVAGELMAARKQDEPGAELEAARAYVRKRRLGPYRSAEKREEYRHKDLASLARQGFSFDVAKQALGPGPGTDEEF
jgi:regulatory protein